MMVDGAQESRALPVVLSVEGVTHRYGSTASVEGVDFSIRSGEIACLVGPSGCGKTTLLRLISGLEVPQRGRILIDGAEVAGEKRFVAPERRPVGMVFQDYALFPHLNVNQNIVFGLKKVDPKQRYRRATEIMRQIGIEDLKDRYPHTLSGGQQQRIALARALAVEPRLMLMDEPFSGLDATLRFSVREETRQILRVRGTASVVVTHDGEEAMHLADRIILMRKGRVEQIGTPEDLFFRPVSQFAACFFGAVNRFSGQGEDGAVQSGLGSWKFRGDAINGAVTVVVRHHAFHFEEPRQEGGYLPLRLRVLESKLIGGQRQTSLENLSGQKLTLFALHRATHALVPGEVVPCWLDARMVHVFPGELT